MQAFNEALREAVARRVNAGESMTEVAYTYGISEQTLYNWLNGTQGPRLNHYVRICEVEGWPVPAHYVATREQVAASRSDSAWSDKTAIYLEKRSPVLALT